MISELIDQRINAAACNGKEDTKRELVEFKEAAQAMDTKTRSLLIRAINYAHHGENCYSGLWRGRKCTCGLERLEAEIREVLK